MSWTAAPLSARQLREIPHVGGDVVECAFALVFQRLDVEKETIELVHSNPTETCDLPCRVPKDTPRYHFFLYKHSHEGDYLESIGTMLIFVLSLSWHLYDKYGRP